MADKSGTNKPKMEVENWVFQGELTEKFFCSVLEQGQYRMLDMKPTLKRAERGQLETRHWN
jgi:hypothetical protein